MLAESASPLPKSGLARAGIMFEKEIVAVKLYVVSLSTKPDAIPFYPILAGEVKFFFFGFSSLNPRRARTRVLTRGRDKGRKEKIESERPKYP